MRKHIKPIVAVILIGLIVWSYIHFKDYRPVNTDARLMHLPEILLSVEDIKLAGRSKGHQIWRVDAKRLTLSQNRRVTNLENIHNGAIFQDGKSVATVKAGRATYDGSSLRISASGGVNVKSTDGTVFQTSRVIYDGITNKLICPAKVTLVRGETRGSVDRLEADLANDLVIADNLNMRTTTKDIEELQEGLEKQR